MAQKLYEESNIQAIADAIRGKNGLSDTYKTSEMAAAISAIEIGGAVEALNITSNGTYTAPDGIDGYNPVTVNVPQDGSLPEEAFIISGNCSYMFSNNNWNWFIENYNNKITTQNITVTEYMFSKSSELESIPFDFNFASSQYNTVDRMFQECTKLKTIGKFINIKPYSLSYVFYNCYNLRYIPSFLDVNWTYLQNNKFNSSSTFQYCYSLREIPEGFFEGIDSCHINPAYCFTKSFTNLFVLDEFINFPTFKIDVTIDLFTYYSATSFRENSRLKNFIFQCDTDGTARITNWKNQLLDLSYYVGYARIKSYILDYNSGITADKEVTDDATYQALKDDPDWFTTKIEYSRYNHDSAVRTINSLPDTSAYLASAGGTNTLKLKGDAGSATDGGAINTLTAEEIAVATAKGWTVTLV